MEGTATTSAKTIPFNRDRREYEPTELRVRLKDRSAAGASYADIDLDSVKPTAEGGRDYINFFHAPARLEGSEVVVLTIMPKKEVSDRPNFAELVRDPILVTIKARPKSPQGGGQPKEIGGQCQIRIEPPWKNRVAKLRFGKIWYRPLDKEVSLDKPLREMRGHLERDNKGQKVRVPEAWWSVEIDVGESLFKTNGKTNDEGEFTIKLPPELAPPEDTPNDKAVLELNAIELKPTTVRVDVLAWIPHRAVKNPDPISDLLDLAFLFAGDGWVDPPANARPPYQPPRVRATQWLEFQVVDHQKPEIVILNQGCLIGPSHAYHVEAPRGMVMPPAESAMEANLQLYNLWMHAIDTGEGLVESYSATATAIEDVRTVEYYDNKAHVQLDMDVKIPLTSATKFTPSIVWNLRLGITYLGAGSFGFKSKCFPSYAVYVTYNGETQRLHWQNVKEVHPFNVVEIGMRLNSYTLKDSSFGLGPGRGLVQ